MEGTAGPGALRRRSLSGRSKVGAPTGRGGDSPRRTPLLPRRVTAVPGRAPSRSRTARPPIPPTSLGRRNERQLNLASAPAGLRPPAAAKQACAAARCSRVYGHVHSLWGTAVRPSPPDGSPMAARHCSEELPGRPERQHRQTPRGERAAGSGPCAVPAARRSVRGGIGAARVRPLSPHRRRRGRGPLLHYASAPDLARPRPSAVAGACPGQPGRALRGQRRPRGRDHRLVAGPRDLPAAQHFRGRGAHPPIEPRFHRLNVRRGSMSCDSRRGACQSVTTEQAQRDRQTNRSRFNRDQSTFAGTGHRLRRAAGTSFLPVFCLLAKECLWELRLVSVTGNSFRSPIARTLRDGPGGLSVESERLQPQPQGRPAATAELPWPEGWPQPGAQDAMGWLGVLFGSLLLAVAVWHGGFPGRPTVPRRALDRVGHRWLWGGVDLHGVAVVRPPVRLPEPFRPAAAYHVQDHGVSSTGVALPYSRSRVVRKIAAGVGLSVSGLGLALVGWWGLVWGATLLLCVGTFGVIRPLRHGAGRGWQLVLLPQGILYQEGQFRTFAPWDHILEVRAYQRGSSRSRYGPPGLGLLVDKWAVIDTTAGRLGRLFPRDWGSGVDVGYPVDVLAVDPVLVYAALCYYRVHPEARAELGDHRGLQRLLSQDLR